LGKVEKFRNPLILWQLVGNYSLNIVMLDFIFSPHNVVTWVYLFPPKNKQFVPFASSFLFWPGCENSLPPLPTKKKKKKLI